MKIRSAAAVGVACFALGLVGGSLSRRAEAVRVEPAPDLTGEVRIARMPGGPPDAPAPDGGKFRPVVVTVDGERQTFVDGAPPAQWVFFLAGGRVVIHAVRVPD